MMDREPTIRVIVDPTNPGQFFACCGLLELADRLWAGTRGCFQAGQFCITSSGTLGELMTAVTHAELCQENPWDDYSSPIELGPPIRLRLDWWTDERTVGRSLKVWAGSMRNVRIARAMQHAIRDVSLHDEDLLNRGMIVYDPAEPDKKVEPFYFDARRGANAQSLDVGFAPDALQMTTTAYPAVEFFCLTGLQRTRPARTETARVFDYFTWSMPLPVELLPVAVSGHLAHVGATGYRFENGFRTDQRKHKSFLPATLTQGER